MLPTHQRLRKGVFFEMSMGSISPGPRKHNIILLLFIFKSRDFVDMRANNQAVSGLTSITTTTTMTATTVQQHHHHHHHHHSSMATTTTTTATKVGVWTMRKGHMWVFFYFFSFSLVLNDIHRSYRLSKGTEGFSTGHYGDNRPNSKFFFSFLYY